MEKKNIIGCVAYLAICLAVYALGDALPRVNFGEETLCSWVGATLVGLSAAGSILGGILGNSQRRKQRRALQDKQRKLDAWRDEQLGADYLSRADSQAALRTIRENIDEQMKAANTDAIKGGMTDEAKAAYASKMNRGYADAVSQIAGLGEKYRDRVRDIHMQQTDAIDNALLGLNSTSGAEALASGIVGAASSLASIVGTGSKTAAQTAHNALPYQEIPNDPIMANKYKINIVR